MATPQRPAASSVLPPAPDGPDDILKLRAEVAAMGTNDNVHMSVFKPTNPTGITPAKRMEALLEAEKARQIQHYQTKIAQQQQELQLRLQREIEARHREDALARRAIATLGHRYGLQGTTFGDPNERNSISKAARDTFVCVTTDYVPGFMISECIGAVSGTAIRDSADPELHPERVDEAPGSLAKRERAEATKILVDNAILRGANAVVGLRFDCSAPIGPSHVEMIAYGTAVVIKKNEGKKGEGHQKDNDGGGEKGKKGNKNKEESPLDLLRKALTEDEPKRGKKGSRDKDFLSGTGIGYDQILAVMNVLERGPGKGSGGANDGWGGGGNAWSGSGGGADDWNTTNNNDGWGTAGWAAGSSQYDKGGTGVGGWGGVDGKDPEPYNGWTADGNNAWPQDSGGGGWDNTNNPAETGWGTSHNVWNTDQKDSGWGKGSHRSGKHSHGHRHRHRHRFYGNEGRDRRDSRGWDTPRVRSGHVYGHRHEHSHRHGHRSGGDKGKGRAKEGGGGWGGWGEGATTGDNAWSSTNTHGNNDKGGWGGTWGTGEADHKDKDYGSDSCCSSCCSDIFEDENNRRGRRSEYYGEDSRDLLSVLTRLLDRKDRQDKTREAREASPMFSFDRY